MEKNGIKYIDADNGVKGFYKILNPFTFEVTMTSPYHVTAKYILDKGTLEDDSETDALIKRRLDYFYYCIETIKLDLDGFKKLSANYSSIEQGLRIQLLNKVFYSQCEEDRYRADMKRKLKEEYCNLYDRYIIKPLPILKSFKDILDPRLLPCLIESIDNRHNN